jgi:hypothetical protein
MHIHTPTNLEKAYFRKKYPELLSPFEKRIHSQNGEDGIIAELLYRIGTDSRFAVEFGVEDGAECNTRLLKDQGWRVLQMDGEGNKKRDVKQAFILPNNINQLFKKFGVPDNLDMLSIDIDSNDYWVWKAIDERYQPRLVIVEYNATISPCESLSVAYDPKLTWNKTNYFGASLLALYRLAKSKGYELVYCNDNGVNAFFVRRDLMQGVVAMLPTQAYRGPTFGRTDKWGATFAHQPAKKQFVTINEDLEADS